MANTAKQHPPRQDSLDRPPALSRSQSANSSHGHLRPKSRGSTASLQSVGVGNSFQPIQPNQAQQVPVDQSAYFLGNVDSQQQQHQYPPLPEDPNMIGYPQHMQQMRPPQPSQMITQHDMRPISQHGYHGMQPMPVQFHEGMPYPMPTQHVHHMRHASEQYEGSPAPEDSNNENGSKRRKGASASLANDQELRRLLQQYQGRSLQDIASEVQKNEGAGGKSEKAKQVFAMLWLQETCQRSNSSVRRDRVFARYIERCGDERVPTLNPASFGKLVRIIFPNVQTRRLGVRGESKYHYVDLSLVPDDNDPGFDTLERPTTSSGVLVERPASSASMSRPLQLHTKPVSLDVVPPRLAIETADFPEPAPSLSQSSILERRKPRAGPTTHKLDCQHINTPIIRIARGKMSPTLLNVLPFVRSNMPATLSTYLSMPSKSTLCQPIPSSQESPIELPNMHEYLSGENYDHDIAKLLHDLYRSYCIDVIDAFRKCKDKSFFNHHSAFNGKMTVPVSKLFNMECLAPWIQECDMRMYKQILRYMTPLVLQDVPEQVWNSFDRISQKLVGYLISSFEEKCPPHVVAAKVVPATRFSDLLRKLRQAQASTLQLNRMLESPQARTQMWLDMCSVIDPEALLQDCVPPPESVAQISGILKHDIRALLGPEPDPLVSAAESDHTSSFAQFYRNSPPADGVLLQPDVSADLIVRLVSWLESLPAAFEGHHAQCMLDWRTRFFRALMNQFGAGGALSYQSWWYLENFSHCMLTFMTELEGFLLLAEQQKVYDRRETDKSEEYTQTWDNNPGSTDELYKKRKRTAGDIGNDNRTKSPTLSRPNTAGADTEPEPDSAVSITFPATTNLMPANAHKTITNPPLLTPTSEFPPHIPRDTPSNHHAHAHAHASASADLEDDDDMADITRGGPLDLPSFKTGFTSPVKPGDSSAVQRLSNGLHDDSGIGMGMDDEVVSGHVHAGLDADALEAEKEAKKFNKRDWFLSSDPVEPAGCASIGVSVS